MGMLYSLRQKFLGSLSQEYQTLADSVIVALAKNSTISNIVGKSCINLGTQFIHTKLNGAVCILNQSEASSIRSLADTMRKLLVTGTESEQPLSGFTNNTPNRVGISTYQSASLAHTELSITPHALDTDDEPALQVSLNGTNSNAYCFLRFTVEANDIIRFNSDNLANKTLLLDDTPVSTFTENSFTYTFTSPGKVTLAISNYSSLNINSLYVGTSSTFKPSSADLDSLSSLGVIWNSLYENISAGQISDSVRSDLLTIFSDTLLSKYAITCYNALAGSEYLIPTTIDYLQGILYNDGRINLMLLDKFVYFVTDLSADYLSNKFGVTIPDNKLCALTNEILSKIKEGDDILVELQDQMYDISSYAIAETVLSDSPLAILDFASLKSESKLSGDEYTSRNAFVQAGPLNGYNISVLPENAGTNFYTLNNQEAPVYEIISLLKPFVSFDKEYYLKGDETFKTVPMLIKPHYIPVIDDMSGTVDNVESEDLVIISEKDNSPVSQNIPTKCTLHGAGIKLSYSVSIGMNGSDILTKVFESTSVETMQTMLYGSANAFVNAMIALSADWHGYIAQASLPNAFSFINTATAYWATSVKKRTTILHFPTEEEIELEYLFGTLTYLSDNGKSTVELQNLSEHANKNQDASYSLAPSASWAYVGFKNYSEGNSKLNGVYMNIPLSAADNTYTTLAQITYAIYTVLKNEYTDLDKYITYMSNNVTKHDTLRRFLQSLGATSFNQSLVTKKIVIQNLISLDSYTFSVSDFIYKYLTSYETSITKMVLLVPLSVLGLTENNHDMVISDNSIPYFNAVKYIPYISHRSIGTAFNNSFRVANASAIPPLQTFSVERLETGEVLTDKSCLLLNGTVTIGNSSILGQGVVGDTEIWRFRTYKVTKSDLNNINSLADLWDSNLPFGEDYVYDSPSNNSDQMFYINFIDSAEEVSDFEIRSNMKPGNLFTYAHYDSEQSQYFCMAYISDFKCLFAGCSDSVDYSNSTKKYAFGFNKRNNTAADTLIITVLKYRSSTESSVPWNYIDVFSDSDLDANYAELSKPIVLSNAAIPEVLLSKNGETVDCEITPGTFYCNPIDGRVRKGSSTSPTSIAVSHDSKVITGCASNSSWSFNPKIKKYFADSGMQDYPKIIGLSKETNKKIKGKITPIIWE